MMTATLAPEAAAVLSRMIAPRSRFSPVVGLRVRHNNGRRGTIRTVVFSCSCDGPRRHAGHRVEGFIEFDGGGSLWSVFALDVSSVLSDADELRHVG